MGKMSKDSSREKKRILKASRMLQAKVGTGDIDKKKVEKSQKIIDGNSFDFVPMAGEFLRELEQALEKARGQDGYSSADFLEALREPVMQLKANAAMFSYPLITTLAGIMLNFLESVQTLDSDVIDIVEAHRRTLDVIIRNKMQGDGGSYGQDLQKELRDACRRYFAKQASGDAKDEPFFIE